MAKSVDDELKSAWSGLSYLTHPRSAISYSSAETAGVSQLGMTQEGIFALRAGKAVEWYSVAADSLIASLVVATTREVGSSGGLPNGAN